MERKLVNGNRKREVAWHLSATVKPCSIGGRRFVCQFFEPDTFARCALLNIAVGGHLDSRTRRNIYNIYGTTYGLKLNILL